MAEKHNEVSYYIVTVGFCEISCRTFYSINTPTDPSLRKRIAKREGYLFSKQGKIHIEEKGPECNL